MHYLGAAHTLAQALKASRIKITVFLSAVSVLVLILGSFMYLIEGAENGFTSKLAARVAAVLPTEPKDQDA